jgi:hypothetical protein
MFIKHLPKNVYVYDYKQNLNEIFKILRFPAVVLERTYALDSEGPEFKSHLYLWTSYLNLLNLHRIKEKAILIS